MVRRKALGSLEFVPDGVIVVDRHGCIVQVNAQAEKMFGYKRGELCGRPVEVLIPNRFREVHVGHRAGYVASPRLRLMGGNVEIFGRRKDGSEFPADINLSPVQGESGVMVTCFVRDITERKRAEEEIQRHRQRQAALHDINVATTSTLDLRSVLEILLAKVESLLPYSASVVWLLDRESGVLERGACWSLSEEEWRGRKLEGIPHAVKAVVENRTPVAVRNLETDPRPLDPQFFRQHHFVSRLGVPLIAKGEILGAIFVFTREEHDFTNEEVEFFTTLAAQAAIAIHNSQLYEQVERRTQGLSALQTVTATASGSLDLDTVLQEVIKKITEIFHFDATQIFLFNVQMDELNLRASFENLPEHWDSPRVFTPGKGIVGRVAETGEPVVFENAQTDPRYQEWSQSKKLLRAGFSFFAVFPVKSKLRTVGTIVSIGRNPRRLTCDEIQLITSMADQIAVAVKNASLFEETRSRASELSALYSVASVVNQSLDIEFVLRSVMHKVLEIFDFDAARIYLYDENKKELYLLVHQEFPKDAIPHNSYKPGQGILGKVFERGEPILFEDIQNDPEFHRMVCTGIALRAGYRGSFGIPIKVKGKKLGVINFVSKSVHRFSSNEVQLIHSIANHLGVALENVRLYQESRRREEIQGLLKEISQDITSLDIDSLLKKLTEKVCELFNVDMADVRVLEGERWHVRGLSGIDPDSVPASQTGTARGRSGWIVKNRRALMIPDITRGEGIASGETLEHLGIRGYLGVPLFSREAEVIGVLRALSYQPREFTQEETDLLQHLANGAAIALENARLFEQIQQKSGELEALVKTNRDIAAVLDRETLLARIAEQARKVLKMDNANFRLIEGEYLVAVSSSQPEDLSFRHRLRLGESLSGKIIQENRILTIRNVLDEPTIIEEHREMLRKNDYHGFLGIPMQVGGRPIGTINLLSHEEREFSQEEISLISAFADQAAIAIENARLFAEIKEKSQELEEANRAK
ncbi:MAG: GAF domain-containing protein, partial [Candidatus Binatia bacterium]